MMSDDIIELSEDGVFEVPSPRNAIKAPRPQAVEEEEVYPVVASAAAVPAATITLDDVKEGEYKVFLDESSKQLHVVINLSKAEGDATKVEWKDRVLTVITSSGSKIPIDLGNIGANTARVSSCSARRKDNFLVVLVPLA